MLHLHQTRTAWRDIDRATASIWMLVPRWLLGGVPRSELRELAQRVADEAHLAKMLPEHLVLAVKDSWAIHPALRDPCVRQEAQPLLADVVGLCITEYFRARDQEQQIRLERE
jgi:hypothetical protein